MADGIGSPFGFCIVGGANSVPCSDMEKAAVALVAESLPGDLLGALVLDAANELLPEWLRFRMTAGDR
jgi:hypothetical protein